MTGNRLVSYTKEQQLPNLMEGGCKRLELFQTFAAGWQSVSLLHACAETAVNLMTSNCDYRITPYAVAMSQSNAQRQSEYQRRQREAGAYRLDALISADAGVALAQVVEREGCSRKEAIERSIFNEAKGRNMHSQFRRDDPATDPIPQPARKAVPMTTKQNPSRMTADEAAHLEQFKTKVINDHLDARELQANGGTAGVARKAALNAMLDANNQHRQK